MEFYLSVKLLHILSSTILFGTGLGSAFFMWQADRSGELTRVAATARYVVLVDGVFTAPAVIVQPVTGLFMLGVAGIPLSTYWVLWSIALYVAVGLCWLPVIWLQARIAKMATEAEKKGTEFNYPHRLYMRWWYSLGWPAFLMVIGVFYLMVFKPL